MLTVIVKAYFRNDDWIIPFASIKYVYVKGTTIMFIGNKDSDKTMNVKVDNKKKFDEFLIEYIEWLHDIKHIDEDPKKIKYIKPTD